MKVKAVYSTEDSGVEQTAQKRRQQRREGSVVCTEGSGVEKTAEKRRQRNTEGS